ncbi:MAG: hypothetical protein QNK33_01625 [Bacteroidales bacterium]|nr:hypothetical protein [Bacteroidales bacterium]
MSLLIGVLAFMLVTLMMIEQISPLQFNPEDPLLVALIVITLLGLPLSRIAPKIYLKGKSINEGLSQKMTVYKTAFIIKAAIWVGIAEFAIIVFMLSGNALPLIIAIISMVIIASYYPNIERIVEAVQLTQEEIEELKK